jgi:LysR family transcriptional regulator, low CO2-responsive transcriptional regulator
LEFDQLRTFLAVVEHGSFTRAAEALGLSQSTVSFQIKALESSVDNKLIDRGRDGLELTAHGRVLREHARRMLELRREAQTSMRAIDEGLVGRVTVAASTIPGEHLLPSALAALRRTHRGVSVSVTVSDSRRAIASLLASEVDMALVGGKPRDRRLSAVRFAQDEVVLVGPSPTEHRVPANGSLHGLPLVLRQEGSGTRDAIADVLATSLAGGAPSATVEVGSTVAVLRCVEVGLGLGFVSRLAMSAAARGGRVQRVDHPMLPVRRSFYVAWRKASTASPAAAALMAILTAQNENSSQT